ncbi:glycosylphosphatidylinositol phospholipase D [Cavenderia fasciculata]|uniref:Phosphatidylinositol-glycan-specific phospholipase D n=1 Tax=Cavenderia fasciculata TaxID=261658 RepID=F4PNZ9_CACFS|nr:glycosylphosphatidylinositol phospholipase D [Cavenderia fasciculata]EGG22678.1 glycosylphosphatidylinositol phospholipase D [Cavenderia fasciculata]|eukprot:XP_004360529.1 glycosylphosphatidylinositol phospholipase D [Cavenderia fasciculata]
MKTKKYNNNNNMMNYPNQMIMPIMSYFMIIFILIVLPKSEACGMTTHNEVARRAFNFSSFQDYPQFQTLIPQYLSSFQAGASFPDWGYDCGNSGNESESAHWPPFLRNATVYLKKTYPQPWSEAGAKLAVFLMGVLSHQVADISWHSIGGIHEGLIRAMAGQDFNSDYSIAHTNADVGGEYVLAYNYDLSWLVDRWDVPISDVKNIYSMMNYDVSEFTLLRCNAILFAGAMAVKEGGKLLYPEIASKSQFLIDHYQDYFNGGLDDMAMWTSYCWPVLMGWMDGAEIGDFCFIQPDPSFNSKKQLMHEAESKLTGDQKKRIISSKLADMIKDHIFNSLSTTETGDGGFQLTFNNGFVSPRHFEDDPSYFYQISDPYGQALRKLYADVDRIYHQPVHGGPQQPDHIEQLQTNFSTIFGSSFYSYFGREIQAVDLNGDGIEDILVSAPGEGEPGSMQTGCVYYILLGPNSNSSSLFGNDGNADIANVASGKVCGTEVHARFGWAIAALDFNLDGVMDLAVGAPSSSNANLKYFGATYVYFGSIDADSHTWSLSSQPSILINGTDYHDQAGYILTAGDCNADGHPDLIMGMPTAKSVRQGAQRGKVAIFYSTTKRVVGQRLDVDVGSNWLAIGEVDYEWFGHDVKVAQTTAGSFLLIGSPNFHRRHVDDAPMNLGYKFQVVNGTFIGIEDPLLVLSLPTRCIGSENSQVGEIVFIEFVNLKGFFDLNQTVPLLSVQGNTKYSRFGESILMETLTPDAPPSLFIGAPLWTNSFDNTGSGCVFSFDSVSSNIKEIKVGGGDNKEGNKGYTTHSYISGKSVNNNIRDSRFGFKVVLIDINQDGKKDLLVGADRDSSKFIEGGSLNIFITA